MDRWPGFRSTGYTIIELMIVVTIIGVLAAFAIPAFDGLIKNNRRATTLNELLAGVMTARSEAAKRGQPVAMCAKAASGTGCNTSDTEKFDPGWIVFLDPNGDGVLAADTDVLRRFANDYPDIRIRLRDKSGPIIVRPFNQASTQDDIVVCDSRGSSEARAVLVASNGRSRVADKDSTGAALDCVALLSPPAPPPSPPPSPPSPPPCELQTPPTC